MGGEGLELGRQAHVPWCPAGLVCAVSCELFRALISEAYLLLSVSYVFEISL